MSNSSHYPEPENGRDKVWSAIGVVVGIVFCAAIWITVGAIARGLMC